MSIYVFFLWDDFENYVIGMSHYENYFLINVKKY